MICRCNEVTALRPTKFFIFPNLMNGVLRPVDNCGHVGHTYILTNAKWK